MPTINTPYLNSKGQFWLILFAITLLFSLSACSEKEKSEEISEENVVPGHTNPGIVLEVSTSNTYQTIAHFGASDAWSCQFVGNWPLAKKTAIADLLFSKEMDANDSPKGIGLSMWRFNIGAGSAAQGISSNISDEWRRAESFLQEDGTYNWNKQAGQMWFAQQAKAAAVENLLVFPNSPPVTMTKNGRANTDNAVPNLESDKFSDYAKYLATVIQGMEQQGLKVDYISPVNEPQWDWNDGQEGTPFFNSDIAGIVKELNSAIAQKNLQTKIDIAEAGQLNFLYENGDKGHRGNQIEAFFSVDSENYIGNLSHVSPTISGHSYFTTHPFDNLKRHRSAVAEKTASIPNLSFWMSEYCILEDNDQIKGVGRDLGMAPAIYTAKVIHTDLAVGNASAWHWWLAISPYNYKDGLIYIDKNKQDGAYYESKLLWALGNYSRFIRPGYKRTHIQANNNPDNTGSLNENLLFSSYQSKNGKNHVIVVINSNAGSMPVGITLDDEVVTGAATYITDASKDLELTNIESNGIFTLPAKSIVTLIVNKTS